MTDLTCFPDNMLSAKDLVTKREQIALEKRAQEAQNRVNNKVLIKIGAQPQ